MRPNLGRGGAGGEDRDVCSIWNRSHGIRKPTGKHPLDEEIFRNTKTKQNKLLDEAGIGADYLEKAPPTLRNIVDNWNNVQRKIAETAHRVIQEVNELNCRQAKAELSGIAELLRKLTHISQETTFAYCYKPGIFFGPVDLAIQSIYIGAESILAVQQLNRN